MQSNNQKIAFIGWNPFQLIHVSSLIKSIPNSIFILENKHNSLSQFNHSLLNRRDVPIKVYLSKDIHKLDNIYDVIVCQTVFTDIHKFEKAKIAMIQYGYAKEAHNYGPWRSLADVCFTYGSYASKKISYFCPTKEINFLRKEEANDPLFLQSAQDKYHDLIDPNKKTILFLPTWGECSSISRYSDKIKSLLEGYNVLVKVHHNSDLLGFGVSTKLKKQIPHTFGANDDSLQLMLISDVIISDYSGAIFDAIFCKKPVILLDSHSCMQSSDKVDKYSLEFQRRDELGYVVNSPDDLLNSVKLALSGGKTNVSDKLYNNLFSGENKSHQTIKNALLDLSNNKNTNPLSQQQFYIRSAMKKLYGLKYSSASYNALNKIQTLYSKVMLTVRAK